MTHPIYDNLINSELLQQGDILDPIPLKRNLRGHQDYFANQTHFYRFMILTQTCDLTHKEKMPDFIFLAVVRKFSEAISIRHVYGKAKNGTQNMLRDLFNHNYNKRGFFYLPENTENGIEEDSLVDLRVMFSLHKSHYQDLVNAKVGAISPLYSSQLGHMVGYMFSRIAVPGWSEINNGESAEKKAKEVVKSIKEREDKRLAELKAESQNKCVFANCGKKAISFRWVNVRLRNQSTKYMECVMCQEHTAQWDNNTLPQDTYLRDDFN